MLLSHYLISQKSFIADVQLCSQYAFYMQCQPIDWFLFETNFHRKFFSKQAIKIWILIIPWNMFKLRAKKIYTKYDKIWIFEKNQHLNNHRGKKWSWMVWGFSVIQQKHALACPGLYRPIFQSLWYTSLISPGCEINETVQKERHSSKTVNTLISKTILFISQNMFQSIHTSSSAAKRIIPRSRWQIKRSRAEPPLVSEQYISQDHEIKGSGDILGRSLLNEVIILPSLVVIATHVIEILWFWFVTWLRILYYQSHVWFDD